MIESGFVLVIAWHAALILILLVHAWRTRPLVGKLIAFDALSIVLISALVVLGLHRRETVYLDIALILAMLVFVQTVAAVRLLERRSLQE